jgi:hypothetical protein
VTPAGFVVCEPSTRYYKVMTRSEWMPCLSVPASHEATSRRFPVDVEGAA